MYGFSMVCLEIPPSFFVEKNTMCMKAVPFMAKFFIN